ncbi:MAG: glycoside hydrolase family 3 protein [Clostridia bacterium]|nr:glycoside hydrolase family 3 protein [Clostridia bacterium]
MNRIINKCVRFFIKTFGATGLEQELNQSEITSELTVPGIVPVARQMAAEGIVLLKNDNKTLPVRAEDTVAVFGRTAVDYFTVGYGSGGDVIPPYKSSLMDGLRANEVKIEENLASVYDAWCHNKKNVPDEGFWGHWPMSYPEMPLSEKTVSDVAKNSDIALVVIGRAAGEDRENLLKKGSYYLTDREIKMLDLVTRHFTRVCVILDCGNIIDMSWTVRYGDRISAIVYAWQGGMESGYALADVLTGKVSPSGKLTDTIAVNYEAYPGNEHFGGKKFNTYSEDIYVGYRYFETFSKDKVLYPFGFGLSYTDFELKTECENIGNEITIQTQVTNTGAYAGKQVVQCYLNLPCGKLGNPAKILAAFAKTETLAPSENQTLTMKINLADFAPYDDSGMTGHKSCHVLEAGVYGVEVGTDVRETTRVLTIEKAETEVAKELRETLAVRPENSFKRLVNKNGVINFADVPTATKDLKKQILEELPEELKCTEKDITFDDVISGKYTAEEFVAQLSPEELDDLTHGEGKMNSSYGINGNAGAFGGVTEKLRSRGIPAMITTDGPSGIRIRRTVSLLPCGTALASSFNTEGIEQLYSLVSEEMANFDVHMLLAPGMNIHRNPLCGRNFEYFSEDPFLSGKIAAAAIRGIQKTGRSACPKHFACNNQETNRNYNDSRLSERALREIYLKGFEIAVKEANPYSIMTSYNKINGVWSHYNYELVTQILRQEWGYKGLIITDWWMRAGASREFPNIKNDAYRVRAQVDVLMPGEFGKKGDPDARSLIPSMKSAGGVTLAEAQRSALNVIKFILRIKKS